MAVIKETDPRFINVEKKIGMFVLIAIAGIALVIAFIGIQQDVFTSKTEIYFITDSGEGITEGMAVKLSGFKIGKVKKLNLDDVAKVKVELSINTRYMKWIKTDSKARLAKEGLIGDSIIEITPGSAKASQIAEKGMISFARARGLSDIAEELKEEVTPVLTEIKEIIHYVNDPQGDIKHTLKNISKLSDEVFTTKQHLDNLLKDAGGSMKKIDPLLDSTKKTMTTVESMVQKIDKDLPSMMEKIDKSLTNVQKMTDDIKKATEQSAPKIPSLVEKGDDIAGGTKEIIDSVKKMWPIRSFIKNPEEKTLKVDSYE
ncbi:MAG: MCE family protein [Thermodesulfovibrio sp.]|nr:MCE family protein [Thermodesulfovibrio sp.]